MNTKVLRESEREALEFPVGHVMLFVDRLIEEREKSARLEAELADALELVSDAFHGWMGEVWQADAMALLGRYKKAK